MKYFDWSKSTYLAYEELRDYPDKGGKFEDVKLSQDGKVVTSRTEQGTWKRVAYFTDWKLLYLEIGL